MMLASGWATRVIASAAWFTSCRVRSVGPAIESSTPFAPSIELSSNGELIAAFAASVGTVRVRDPSPMPMRAEPAPDMTDFTSAKSRLIRPGVVISDVMPSTP